MTCGGNPATIPLHVDWFRDKTGARMSTAIPISLKEEITSVLTRQGYSVAADGVFALRDKELEGRRRAHALAKAERVAQKKDFILDNVDLIGDYLVDGAHLDIAKITPELIEVKSGAKEEKMFKWWNIVWWSLPYEKAYGRQMRFVVWDRRHDAPIGLIGLQSPILSWGPRDKRLGINPKERDYWVNQSLSAQRIGALPPYNDILGGKLVTLLMTSNTVRDCFKAKYSGKKTIMRGRVLPANLLFITTTGAYGKSSVYNRLKFNGAPVSQFIGYTQGCGTFHIPNALYEDLLEYLESRGVDTNRGFGNGPSRKLRLIDEALNLLGFTNGVTHGIKRALYLFPLAKNLSEVINGGAQPAWHDRTIWDLTALWKQKWAFKRDVEGKRHHLRFSGDSFINDTKKGLEKYKELSG